MLAMQPRQCRRGRAGPALPSPAREGLSGGPVGQLGEVRPPGLLRPGDLFPAPGGGRGGLGGALLLAAAPSAVTPGSGPKTLHVTSRCHNVPLAPSWYFRQGLFF